MSGQQPDDSQTTIESCVAKCVALGFDVAGVEYGDQCFCDNYLRNDAALATSDSQCAMSCPGNTAEKCGDGNRMSVYHTGTLVVYHTPVVKKTGIPGNWVYEGCLSDGGAQRSLPWFVQLGQDNSPTACLGACAQFGYNAGGLEYGVECCKFSHYLIGKYLLTLYVQIVEILEMLRRRMPLSSRTLTAPLRAPPILKLFVVPETD
jgi:hypothetical protein